MHFKVWLLVAIVTLGAAQEEEFIDFTYTQLLEQASYTSGPREKIIIHPNIQHLQQYQFPEVCLFSEQLGESQQGEGTVDHFFDTDYYLDQVRDKVLMVLKLAEEVKHSRNYLNEISKHLQLREEVSLEDRFKVQLQELVKRESQLSESKLKIEGMTAELNRRIREYNTNPKNEQLKAVSLNYDIENLNSKIIYLKELRETSIRRANNQPSTNFTEFFNRLSLDLDKESGQIELLDRYFQNVSQLNFLQDTAHSLRDNIEVDRLNIQYKESCEREKQEIISRSSEHAEIKATLTHLREKKKELGNTTNKYCEGVALKLEMQIKRLLKAINWTFTCSEGLQELIQKRQSEKTKLAEIQSQIKSFGEDGIDKYKEKYHATKDQIQRKLNEITSFSIDQYSHDPRSLDQLIEEAVNNKAEAENKLNNLPKEMSGEGVYSQIKDLAEQIKREKAKFCHEFGDYDQQQQRLWFLIYNQEQSRTFASKMRGEYINESRKLEQLENRYRTLSETVIGQLGETGNEVR